MYGRCNTSYELLGMWVDWALEDVHPMHLPGIVVTNGD